MGTKKTKLTTPLQREYQKIAFDDTSPARIRFLRFFAFTGRSRASLFRMEKRNGTPTLHGDHFLCFTARGLVLKTLRPAALIYEMLLSCAHVCQLPSRHSELYGGHPASSAPPVGCLVRPGCFSAGGGGPAGAARCRGGWAAGVLPATLTLMWAQSQQGG